MGATATLILRLRTVGRGGGISIQECNRFRLFCHVSHSTVPGIVTTIMRYGILIIYKSALSTLCPSLTASVSLAVASVR